MGTEIERKFLIERVPDEVPLGSGVVIRQGYVAEEDGVSVRVRITATEAWLTVKAGHGVARTEVEVPITPADAEALWRHTEGRRIAKRRHRIALADGHVAELDVYDGPLAGLRTVEVEFASHDAATAFQPPAWFGRDVTDVPGWSNLELSRHGIPR